MTRHHRPDASQTDCVTPNGEPCPNDLCQPQNLKGRSRMGRDHDDTSKARVRLTKLLVGVGPDHPPQMAYKPQANISSGEPR